MNYINLYGSIFQVYPAPTVDISEENNLTVCVSCTYSYPVKYRSDRLIYGTMFKENDPLAPKKTKGENIKMRTHNTNVVRKQKQDLIYRVCSIRELRG